MSENLSSEKKYKKLVRNKPKNPAFQYSSKVETDTSIDYKGYREKVWDSTDPKMKKFIFNEEKQWYLPSETQLIIDFVIVKGNGEKLYSADDAETKENVVFINNAPLFLFDEMTYKIGRTVVERVIEPGRSSLMHTLTSYSSEWDKTQGLSEGFMCDTIMDENKGITFENNYAVIRKMQLLKASNGGYQVSIDLKRIFSFMADNSVSIRGYSHEFEFHLNEFQPLWKKSDNETNYKLNITSMSVRMTIVTPSLQTESYLMNMMKENKEKDKMRISYFQEKRVRKLPLPAGQRSFNYVLEDSASYTRIRKVIFAFQCEDNIREGVPVNKAIFDNLKLSSYRLRLNSHSYPSDETMIVSFSKGQYARAYSDYRKCFESNAEIDEMILSPMITYFDYSSKYPIFCIDCKNQGSECDGFNVRDGRLELQFEELIPPNCSMYVIFYTDKELRYFLDGTSIKTV